MTAEMKARVKEVFEEFGLGWWVRAGGSNEFFFNHIETLLTAVHAAYARRHGPGFDPFGIFNTARSGDWRIRAFLQAISASSSPNMLVMAWRIIQGMDIETLEMIYHSQKSFRLCVTLISPYGEVEKEPYISEKIEDAALVRHLGIMRMNGRPVFAGFSPLKID